MLEQSIQTLQTTLVDSFNKLVPIGSDGKIPNQYLGPWATEVIEVTSIPVTGVAGKLYINKTTNRLYRWSGSLMVEVNPSPSNAIATSTTDGLMSKTDKTAFNSQPKIKGVGRDVSFTSGVLNSSTVLTPDTDWETQVLIHCEGPDGGNNIIDERGTTIGKYGNPITSTTAKKLGTSSLYINGSSYIYTSTPQLQNVSDFCLEFFIMPKTNAKVWIAGIQSNTVFRLSLESSTGGPTIYIESTALGISGQNSSRLYLDTWYHLAIVRIAGKCTFFIDSVPIIQATSSTTINLSNIYLGANTAGSFLNTCYLDEIRLRTRPTGFPQAIVPQNPY